MVILNARSPLYSSATTQVLQYFFNFPLAEVTLNRLVATLPISKSSAHQAVTRLLREGFLQRKIIGRNWLISGQQRHPYNYSRKIAYFLERILDSELLPALRREFPVAKAIVLFGSYRKGDSTKKSDLDIAIETGPATKILDWGVFRQLGLRPNVPVKVHLFSRKTVNINLFANIANGIVLDGFLEVQP